MTVTNEKPAETEAKAIIDPALSQTKTEVAAVESTKPSSASEEDMIDPNWKAFREARKKDRAEKEAAERRAAEKEAEAAALKAAMEAAFSKSAPTTQAYQQYYGMPGYEQEETEDQRIEKKVNAILSQREQKYLQEQQERERRELPNRLSRDFPDFGQVCSQENLDYLDFHFPELSRPLQRLEDGYDKWADIYRAVKKFIPSHATARKEAARADMNASKPQSISASPQNPMGESYRESWQEVERRRAENWSRMQMRMKGV